METMTVRVVMLETLHPSGWVRSSHCSSLAGHILSLYAGARKGTL